MSFELHPETRLRISNSVYSRPFGKELVLLDFGRGEYFALDEVGAEIWKHLSSGHALSAIAALVANEFEVSEEQALIDIYGIVTKMGAHALVEARASDASVDNLSRS